MRKFIKTLLITVAVLFTLFIVIIIGVVSLGDINLAHPVDESYRKIRIIKTGETDSVVLYLYNYNVGDTIRVFDGGTKYYRDLKEYGEFKKSKKAVVID